MPQEFALKVWAEGVVTTADEEPPTIKPVSEQTAETEDKP